MMEEVDYIIIGQGLCGTFLSWNLMRAKQKVLVIDQSIANSASKIASGVINPVTGRRIVRTWEIETLMPFAVEAYTTLGDELGVHLITQCNMVDFYSTPQMKQAFEQRLTTEKEYLRYPLNTNELFKYFNPSIGVGEINPCWLINLHAMLNGWRKKLIEQNGLLQEKFEISNCSISENEVIYNAKIKAKKIIFCDGISGLNNPYFHLLPYSFNKGEVIFAEIKGLPTNHIYKQGIQIVPWKDNLFWIGSTYHWNYVNVDPTPEFYKKVTQQLSQWLKLPFKIIDHQAAERPANVERRPFVGLHPVFSSVGLFNGMGSKGCSLTPYFAKQLTAHLIDGSPLHPLVNVQRFRQILSR